MFSSPRDILLWDTGHQAYVHKIVTGRRDMFGTLRQTGGLSGYPSRAESVHDWVENSHASTILSYAHGIAAGVARSSTPDRRVVAVIGDGSHDRRHGVRGPQQSRPQRQPGRGGPQRQRPLLRPHHLPPLREPDQDPAAPGLKSVRARIEEALRELPGVGNLAYSSLQGMYSAVREVIEPPAFFEALGVRYVGPIDGHDIPGMEHALRQAVSFDGPIVVHVLTHKGRGYRPAEDDDEKCLHDAPGLRPGGGSAGGVAAPRGYTQAFNEAMLSIGERYPNVVAITAAMPGPTGLLPFAGPLARPLLRRRHRRADGRHLGGGHGHDRPAPGRGHLLHLLQPGLRPGHLDVGLHGLPVVFALDRAGVTGPDGPSHHGVLDLALCCGSRA